MVNNHRGYIPHKVVYKKGLRHDYIEYIKRIILSCSKEVVNVFDLGYLDVETDFPRTTISSIPYRKQRNQHELCQEEIDYNTIHSNKTRIVWKILSADLKSIAG